MSEQPFLPVLSREAAAGDSLGCQSQVSGRNHKQSREAAPGVLRGRRMTQDTPAAASRLTHVYHPFLGLAPQAFTCRRFAASILSCEAAASDSLGCQSQVSRKRDILSCEAAAGVKTTS